VKKWHVHSSRNDTLGLIDCSQKNYNFLQNTKVKTTLHLLHKHIEHIEIASP